jgi:hypothetical protein
MRNTLQRALVFLAIFLSVAFVVLLVNQTAQLVELAARIHPVAGDATLWGLIFLYAGCLAVPIVMLLRLPAPLRPPASDDDPAFDQHLDALRNRLKRNPRVADSMLESREDIESALEKLDEGVDEEIKATGSRVFMTTAISQNGSLDALVVLAIQSRMVWKIAHHYFQRPTFRDLGYLYANVAGTAFLAGELEDLDVAEQIEPIISSALGSAVGAVPGLQAASALLVNSVTSGTANAFMTLRVGYIARDYCSALVLEERRQLRRQAVSRAAGALGSIATSGAKRIAQSLVKSSTRGVGKAVTGMGGAVKDAGSSVVDRLRWKRGEDPDPREA